ncbi:MAG: hypothetical protein LBU32_02610 [Clostridiales bacterium]|jgi:pimeloyl-ACP methyl ester carboxylesterase|nr:hypothetical protein [Clostridiales bacterium]
MEFITCGSCKNPAVLLIHPAKCDGSCFEGLYPYLQDCYLICPTLDGHNLADNSVYESRSKEADLISEYLKTQGISSLQAVAGLSMGALAAFELFRRKEFEVKRLVLDGAPFQRMNPLLKFLFVKSQIAITEKCRKNPHAKLGVESLYPQLAPMMKKITAHYDIASIKNMTDDIGIEHDPCLDSENVIFLYGEKDPCRYSISKLKKKGSRCRVLTQRGFGHVQWILSNPEDYASLLRSG